MNIEEIHNSLVNGQRKQMSDQIKEYGEEFWNDYANFLSHTGAPVETVSSYFTDATISFFRINP